MAQSRELVAIMFTDIVGYTAIMGKDEQKAFDLLNKNRQIQKPIIEAHNGLWIKELGDGIMARFKTVSDAVSAAIEIQKICNAEKEFQLRIGIHQGEVVIEDGDLFGDAVNIASRIQSIATPGSIFVSEVVHHNISNKNDIRSEFVKAENLKNVKEPVKVYRIKLDWEITSTASKGLKLARGKRLVFIFCGIIVLGLSFYFIFKGPRNKVANRDTDVIGRSIAVLPFENRSNDKQQEYFSDGVSEELMNMLSKIPELKVIGRTSSFAFKGRNEDLRTIGEKLDVAHLLEGSVQKDGDSIRVTATLVRASDGKGLWSETYDREQKKIFELQDEIAQKVVQQLKIKLLRFPTSNTSGSGNVEAYDLVLQGNYYFDKLDKENVARAVDLYKQALAKDSTNAHTWIRLANALSRQAWQNYIDRHVGREQAKQATLKAIALDKNLPDGYVKLGDRYLYFEFNWKAAEENYLKALALNPDDAETLYSLGGGLYFALGRWDDAIKMMKKCIELDPLKPLNHLNLGNILSHAGKPDQARIYFNKTLELDSRFQRAHLYKGRDYLIAGKTELAYEEMQQENLEVFRTFGLALVYHAAGKTHEADQALQNFADKFQNEWSYLLAELYAFRNEKNKALHWLEVAYENNDGWLVFLEGDPLLKNLHDDERYNAFLRKMNLPLKD